MEEVIPLWANKGKYIFCYILDGSLFASHKSVEVIHVLLVVILRDGNLLYSFYNFYGLCFKNLQPK